MGGPNNTARGDEPFRAPRRRDGRTGCERSASGAKSRPCAWTITASPCGRWPHRLHRTGPAARAVKRKINANLERRSLTAYEATKVDSTAVISGNVVIRGPYVHINGAARIVGDTRIVGKDSVRSITYIEDDAQIYGSAKMREAQIKGSAKVYGHAVVDGSTTTIVSDQVDVSGTARVIGESVRIVGTGKVDFGHWVGITVRTDRRGACGRNETQKPPR